MNTNHGQLNQSRARTAKTDAWKNKTKRSWGPGWGGDWFRGSANRPRALARLSFQSATHDDRDRVANHDRSTPTATDAGHRARHSHTQTGARNNTHIHTQRPPPNATQVTESRRTETTTEISPRRRARRGIAFRATPFYRRNPFAHAKKHAVNVENNDNNNNTIVVYTDVLRRTAVATIPYSRRNRAGRVSEHQSVGRAKPKTLIRHTVCVRKTMRASLGPRSSHWNRAAPSVRPPTPTSPRPQTAPSHAVAEPDRDPYPRVLHASAAVFSRKYLPSTAVAWFVHVWGMKSSYVIYSLYKHQGCKHLLLNIT